MLRVLFIGDIVGKAGRNALTKHLPFLQEKYQYDLLLVNGENSAHGKGITKKIYDQFINLGVDCITLGNHSFSKSDVYDFIQKENRIIRPYNMEPEGIGPSVQLIQYGQYTIGVFNIYGHAFMENATIDPFLAYEELREMYPCDIRIVDIHAEATSEKYAFMHMFKNEVQLIVGTHTHIQTADEAIWGNTGFICDLGMTGPYDSVLGRDTKEVINNLAHHMNTKYTISESEAILQGIVCDIDLVNKKAVSIERIQIMPNIEK